MPPEAKKLSPAARSRKPRTACLTGGDTDTGVVPAADVWYWFVVEVEDTGTRTDIRAKVWADTAEEPESWQIDAWDESAGRLTSGKIGVWSYSAGSKYWDDLTVEMLAPVNQPPVAEGVVYTVAGQAGRERLRLPTAPSEVPTTARLPDSWIPSM